MLVFQSKHTNGLSAHSKIVILFGTGLIGSSVYKRIQASDEFVSTYLPYNWHHPEQSQQELKVVFHFLENLINSRVVNANSVSHIAFVWCAGNAGFSCSKRDVQLELNNYQRGLALVSDLKTSYPDIKILSHLVSSVGGLFEDQRYIDKDSTAKPLRNYGHLKFEQEKKLLGLGGQIYKHIYRPTSVYGYIGFNQRMGLIPTLIFNGIQNIPSTIFGNSTTLRDYIFNDDIGRHIYSNLFNTSIETEAGIHFLASGKPSSIHEVQQFVEQIIGRKIYLSFCIDEQAANTKNITVSCSALPEVWLPTDIKTGMCYVRDSMIAENSYGVPGKYNERRKAELKLS